MGRSWIGLRQRPNAPGFEYPKWKENYRGTDVDASAIKWLKQRGIPAVTVCNDEVIKLPYKDSELAGLFSFSVLTHIHPDNFRAWFKELARVLKPGALAYLTFNGDTITESTVGSHAKTADEFRDQGAAWLEQPGNYKSADSCRRNGSRVRRGYFEVEQVVARDYNTMDALYARAL